MKSFGAQWTKGTPSDKNRFFLEVRQCDREKEKVTIWLDIRSWCSSSLCLLDSSLTTVLEIGASKQQVSAQETWVGAGCLRLTAAPLLSSIALGLLCHNRFGFFKWGSEWRQMRERGEGAEHKWRGKESACLNGKRCCLFMCKGAAETSWCESVGRAGVQGYNHRLFFF